MIGYLQNIIREWLGYRGILALLLSSPQLGLAVYWISYRGVSLSAGMFYLTLIPFLIAIPLIALLPGKSGLTPKQLGIFAIWALIPMALYDWGRVPFNLLFGVPYWDHFFDWGGSILGAKGTVFTYENLTTGMISHILRGWGFAMAYYILARRVTLLSAFVFTTFMTILFWILLPIFQLTDALPPWIWWFDAWLSHLCFALGLWLAPKLLTYSRKRVQMGQVSSDTRNYRMSKTTLFGVLANQAFLLVVGSILFNYVVVNQYVALYPVFGYGKPPPIVIQGFSSYYWAIPGAILFIVFLYLTLMKRHISPQAR